MPNVSMFGNIYDTVSHENLPLEAYLEEVRDGRWEDLIYKIRNLENEKDKDALKKGIQRITFSGIFSKREDVGLIEHSGFIAIDLDDLEDPEVAKEVLKDDKFVYASFVSTGGYGLTVLFKINPSKHRESFLGISEYLLNNYGLLSDPQSISVSKPLGVTFDPNIYVSLRKVPIFTLYPQEKKVEKIPNFAFASDDFEKLLNELISRKINICEDYNDWLKIGFAFADKFGESGRKYYHLVSSISVKYNESRTDKQYNYCVRAKGLKVATISTFYFYCKEKGLQITSEKTAKVRKATLNSKAAGLSKEKIVENLKKFEGITGVEELVSQIYDGVAQIGDGESLIEQLELYISSNYFLERNVVTRHLERDGMPVSQTDLNSIYIAAKKTMQTINYELMERLLMSDFIKSYNPLIRFFDTLQVVEVKDEEGDFISPHIDLLASSIKNDIPEFTEYFFRKWIVSSISAAHGEHSPLMFVLSGEKHGRGKTEFFRRLLPEKLRHYYAESKLDAGKDDEILMTQKWFIMDDEMSGKSKRETQRLKELTSKQWFSLREPYGRINVDLMRLAVLCATTNFREVLHDPTGNRRIIPIPVDNIDQTIYNSVDKISLFTEAYWLWKGGFEWRVISRDDIEYLRKYEADFEAPVIERELVERYFSPERPTDYMSGTDIKVELEKMTQQRLSLDQLGKQLSKLGFTRKTVRDEDGKTPKKWGVRKVNRSGFASMSDNSNEPNPF